MPSKCTGPLQSSLSLFTDAAILKCILGGKRNLDQGTESCLFLRASWQLCGGPENTQGKPGPSLKDNKLSEGGGMAKGFS